MSWRQVVAGVVFLASVVAAVVMVWRRGQAQLLESSALVSVTFVVAVFAWVFPWYLLPALVSTMAMFCPCSSFRLVLLWASAGY